MKLAIIGTNPYYETDRILYEALKRGHEAVFLPKGDMVQTTFFNKGEFGIFFKPPKREDQMYDPSLFPDFKPPVLTPDSKYVPTVTKKGLLGTKEQPVSNLFDIRYFDAILLREMSKTLEWTTILGSYFKSHNKLLVEQKVGDQMFYRSKHGTFFHSTTNGFPYPKSLAVTSKRALSNMLDYLSYPVIVKKSVSSKGKGVYKCGSKGEVLDLVETENLTIPELLVQELIDYKGDIRIFVVGNKILGAMRREPQAGQWKGNVAQGAKAYPIELTPEIKKLSLDIVALQKSEITGVDIMVPPSGPVIIETNRAPQFRGFESSTGVNVGEAIVHYVEEQFEKLSSAKN